MSIDKLHPNRNTLHPNRLAALPKGEKHWNYSPTPNILDDKLNDRAQKVSKGLKKAYREGRRKNMQTKDNVV